MPTGFIYDPAFLTHDTGSGHPERPARLQAVMRRLVSQPWYPRLRQLTARPADIPWIETTHSLEYIRRAAAACESGDRFLDSMDVAISRESSDVALLAAGAVLALADDVISGASSNGFALVRPPGHHAEHDRALGFCLFNNVAVLARYAQKRHGIDKVAIVDWDVHHGNGTQHTFEADPSVLYVSTHQYPYYPGTGSASETGVGAGKGATLNCPMPAGASDADYRRAFSERILPKLRDFKPELLVISAGFDAHAEDPLAQINLSTDCFGWMTERLLEAADQHAGGRLISVLEGGYHLERLADCVTLHLALLSGNTAS
jgi:acetoin utilization deacetylase AcuC-like enzyme